MYFRKSIARPAEACPDCFRELRGALSLAYAAVTGAGTGLSAPAGFVYNGQRFRDPPKPVCPAQPKPVRSGEGSIEAVSDGCRKPLRSGDMFGPPEARS